VSPRSAAGLLVVAALLLVVLSLWTSDATSGAELAGLAALAATGFLLLSLRDRIHLRGFVPPVVEADSLVLLKNAFRQGRYGRETILARLDGLEGSLPGSNPAERLAERPSLLAMRDDAFLDHVEQRLSELEART